MTLLGELIAAPLLHLVGVPDVVMGMALGYLRIYLAGLPVIFLYNFEAAIFRSQGNTRTPLIVLFISGIVNIILNLFFVLVVGMTADGVALATVLSNLISSLVMLALLMRAKTAIRVSLKNLRPSWRILKNMLRIGMPAGLQGMVFSFSNICVQSAVNSLGEIVMAASSAAFNVEIFAYYIINSFGQACTTFTSQNRGAGLYDRCRLILRTCFLEGCLAAVLAAAILLPPARQVLSLFNENPQVISYGVIRMRYILLFEVVNVAMEVFSGCLRAHEYSIGPAVMTLIGVCGVRILWVYTIFPMAPSFARLMACYPVSWCITSAAIILYYLSKRRDLYPAEGSQRVYTD